MTDLLKEVSGLIGYIVAIGTGLTVIYGWVVKPLKSIRDENAKQSAMLRALDEDTADLLCSQLTREHDYYLTRGWCSASDKRRL